MTVYVAHTPEKRYDWQVQVGTGRGSRILSRHRQKQQAVQTGRQEARKRGEVLKKQMAQTGQWRTVTSF